MILRTTQSAVHFYNQPPGENPAQAARKSVGFLSGLCDIAASISLIAAGLSSYEGGCFDREEVFRSLASRKVCGSIKLLPSEAQEYTVKTDGRKQISATNPSDVVSASARRACWLIN